MKIAFIGHKPAYPKIDGGCVASAAFLQNLVDANLEVHYLMLCTDKHPFFEEKFPEDIRNKVTLNAVAIDTTLKPLKAMQNLFSKKSYNVERFFSEKFALLLEQKIKEEQFDAVIFDNVFAARYLSQFQKNGVKTFVRTHNVEFKIWEDLARCKQNPFKKWYLTKLSRDLKNFEINTLKAADRILSISTDDLKEFEQLGINTDGIVVPVGIKTADYMHDYSKTDLFHLGAMNWTPNIEAVDQVISILPEIRTKLPGITFSIAGKDANYRYSTNEANGIICTGFVSSIETFIKNQGILISPIQSGSGVRIKVLEMMSYGVPIITTSLGASGIEDLSGLIIADSKESMINNVYELVNDEKKRITLGKQAKSVINLHYNPKTITDNVLEFITST